MSHWTGSSTCDCGALATRLVTVRLPLTDGLDQGAVIDMKRPTRIATCETHRHAGAGRLKDEWHTEIARRQVRVIIGPKRRRGLVQ